MIEVGSSEMIHDVVHTGIVPHRIGVMRGTDSTLTL